MERIVTKCICNLLSGFHFSNVPDAIDLIKEQNSKLKEDDSEKGDLELILKQLVGVSKSETENVIKEDEQIVEDVKEDHPDEEEEEIDLGEDQDMVDISDSDKLTKDMQDKLSLKVLPIL